MVEFRHDWLNNFDSMQREMGRLLDYIGSSKPPMVNFAPVVWEPSVDVYETERDIVVLAELAGVKQDEIAIVIDGHNLVIRGQRKNTPREKQRAYYQMEIQRGFFERTISLPDAVDPDKVKASYEDGIVEIVLPKARREKTLRVRVK